MKKWLWLVFAAITVAVIAVFFLHNKSSNVPEQKNAQQQSSGSTVSTDRSPDKLYIGNPNAPVTLVEYGDFKCPNCNNFYHGAEVSLRKDYVDTGKLKIEFRNLPYINPDSRTAAEGAYCANAQGAFTQYHDAVFSHIWDTYYSKGNYAEGESADVFTNEALSTIAKQIGIDSASFSSCLVNRTYIASVDADLKASEQDRVSGTPTIFISNQKIIGAQPSQVYSVLVEKELNQ